MSTEHYFDNLVQTISMLRDPKKGCPWDLKQTHESLIKYLIEEAFEAVHAIETGNPEKIKDELGDVLLQVILHSVIASQKNHFTIRDVVNQINSKMIRRHPHVFTESTVESVEEVKKNWEAIKKQENPMHTHHTFGPHSLANTALLCAAKIGEKTHKIDFDWPSVSPVMEKVVEELSELKDEIGQTSNKKKIEEEFGDLLFSMAQLGRHLGLDPELSLRRANEKFINRFSAMEDEALKNRKKFSDYTREEKEELWKKVKKNEAK